MVELLLQYVWQHRLWASEQMTTTDGAQVLVLDPGRLNTDAGPDFFNAKVKIDGTTWVGNVEVHVRASDWGRHHHDRDRAYDSVILHVVEASDKVVTRTDGTVIPQVVLHISPRLSECLMQCTVNGNEMSCAGYLESIPQVAVTEWVESLALERLQAKVARLYEWLDLTNGNWQEVCYITVARALGMGVNGDAFERLARCTPLHLLGKHADSLLQLEALLLGQAGLLPDDARGDYPSLLIREYVFLRNKFGLQPMDSSVWKMFRMRPHNFPQRRIALLARLLCGGFSLMSSIVNAADSADDERALLAVELGDYWSTHYTLGGEPHPGVGTHLSEATLNVLLINAVAPLLYAYGEATDNARLTDAAVNILLALPAERNRVVATFKRLGLPCHSALDSQAFVQLWQAYCEKNKCIYCRFGHRMLRAAAGDQSETN